METTISQSVYMGAIVSWKGGQEGQKSTPQILFFQSPPFSRGVKGHPFLGFRILPSAACRNMVEALQLSVERRGINRSSLEQV